MKNLYTIFAVKFVNMKTTQSVLFFLTFLLFFNCKEKVQNKDYILKGGVFGTTYKISYQNASRNYQKSLDSLFTIINNSVSTYITTSDISRINNGENEIIVDDIFKEVLKKSKRIHKETNGFFDPTVGNLVNAYGFGPKNKRNILTDEEIKNQMQFVCCQCTC